MPAAAHFAILAQKKLPQGSPDWQRASDIMAVRRPRIRKAQALVEQNQTLGA